MAKAKKKGSRVNTPKGEEIISFGDPSKPDLSDAALKAERARYAKLGRKKKRLLDRLYKQDGMDIRKTILHASIYIERTVEDLLRYLVGPKVAKMHSGFDKQVTFFSAMETLTEEEKTYLNAFGAVRNKFIHRKEINSYTACYAQLGAQGALVLKLINDEVRKLPYNIKGTKEQAYELGTSILIDRVMTACDKVRAIADQKKFDTAYKFVYQRVIKEIGARNGPFGEMIGKVLLDKRTTYTKNDLLAQYRILTRKLNEFFEKIEEEEKEELIKRVEAEERLASAPPASPSRSRSRTSARRSS